MWPASSTSRVRRGACPVLDAPSERNRVPVPAARRSPPTAGGHRRVVGSWPLVRVRRVDGGTQSKSVVATQAPRRGRAATRALSAGRAGWLPLRNAAVLCSATRAATRQWRVLRRCLCAGRTCWCGRRRSSFFVRRSSGRPLCASSCGSAVRRGKCGASRCAAVPFWHAAGAVTVPLDDTRGANGARRSTRASRSVPQTGLRGASLAPPRNGAPLGTRASCATPRHALGPRRIPTGGTRSRRAGGDVARTRGVSSAMPVARRLFSIRTTTHTRAKGTGRDGR